MAETQNENLNSLFAPTGNGLQPDVLGVLESILRLYTVTPQELFYKWESYCLKMGAEETVLDLDTARMFQKDVQDSSERSAHGRQSERKPAVSATPKTASKSGGVYGMLDDLTPNTASRRVASAKRRNDFDTPAPKRNARPEFKTNGSSQVVPFSQRPDPGAILDTLNNQIPKAETPIAPYAEPRIKLVANTDMKKFGYKPMSMRLTESSEVLDERIEEFVALIQKHHKLEDSAFGNAAAQNTNEVVAVGRIVSDTADGRLNKASLMLEMSRRMGAGHRVPLNVEQMSTYSFFPGQIVALRGTNASKQNFQVSEILEVPRLKLPDSTPTTIEIANERLGATEDSEGQPLNILFAAGPYTAEDNLDFEPLQALCEKAAEDMVDAIFMTGPFLDIEHPLLAAGNFDLPDVKGLEEEADTLTLFRLWISSHIEKLCMAVPNITIVMVPNVRDMISRHVSFPQEHILKAKLGLPKQVKMLPDPAFITMNEVTIGLTSHDILYELSQEQLSHGTQKEIMERLPEYLIEQRHFFPLYPPMPRERIPHGAVQATGASLDVGYLKLGEWRTVRPDILLLPSMLTPGTRVIDNVTIINPGTVSKRKAAGTYSQMTLQPRVISDVERHEHHLLHNVFDRARVDTMRI